MKIGRAISGIFILILASYIGINSDLSRKAQQSSILKNISTRDAYDLIFKDEVVIIDVRTPAEFETEYLGNALNYNYYDEDFEDKLNDLDKYKKHILYCRSGKRSERALKQMKEMKFREAYNLAGGILQWKKKGYPVVK